MSKKKRAAYHAKTSAPSQKPSKAPRSDEKRTEAEELVREAKAAEAVPVWLRAAGQDWELLPVSKWPTVKLAEVTERMTVRSEETGTTWYEENPLRMIQDIAWLIGFACVKPQDRARIVTLDMTEFEEMMHSFADSGIMDMTD